MSGLRRFTILLILASLFGWLAPTDSLLGQTPKDKAKTKGKGPLTPEPYQIMAGDPLSLRAMVTRPPLVKNAMSWTIETKRHRYSAYLVAANPEGTLAATTGYDGMIRIWDLTTGKFVRCLVGHHYYCGGLAWSPDGTMLASTGGSDGTARIWNPRTGMTLRILTGHKGSTGALAWAPDSRHLVVTGGGSGFATFWDIDKSKQLKTLEHGTGVYSVAWSPNHKYVACGVGAGGFLWNAETYENVRTTKQDGNTVTCVAFSPDSKHLLTGGQANCNIWEVEEGNKLKTIAGVASITTWCPDNQSLLIAPSGGAPQQFEAKTFKSVKTLPSTVGSMCWAREGKLLVSVHGDKLTAFDMVQSKIVQTIKVAGSWPLEWHHGKPIIAGFGTKSLTLWDANTGRLVHTLDGHTAAINVAKWSPNGKFLATASADKTVRLWDATTYKPVRTLEGHGGSVTQIAWSPDTRIATGCVDGIVRVFAVGNDNAHELKSGKTPPIASLAWSRDGRTLASAASDRVIIWNLEKDAPEHTIKLEHDAQYISIPPDSKELVSVETDAILRIWGLPAGKFIRKQGFGYLSCSTWSTDSTLFAYGVGSSAVGIFNMKTEKPVTSMSIASPIQSVAWSSDQKLLVTGSGDRCVRSWDALTGKLKTTIVADDKQLLTISAEGNYRIAPELESELVAVVQTEKSQDTLDLKAFSAKYGWKNASASAKLLGN